MITAKFFMRGSAAVGFDVSGHSGYADAGSDIVCAAVTSAVCLCECAVNDMFDANADVSVCEKTAQVMLKLTKPSPEAEKVIGALRLQLLEIQRQYSQYIQVLEV